MQRTIGHASVAMRGTTSLVLVIVRGLAVRCAAEIGMGVLVPGAGRSMRMRRIGGRMRLAMLVLMGVGVGVGMRMRVTVGEIAVAMGVLVDMLVRMRVFVAMRFDRNVLGGHGSPPERLWQ
jgi:hypothetical protein